MGVKTVSPISGNDFWFVSVVAEVLSACLGLQRGDDVGAVPSSGDRKPLCSVLVVARSTASERERVAYDAGLRARKADSLLSVGRIGQLYSRSLGHHMSALYARRVSIEEFGRFILIGLAAAMITYVLFVCSVACSITISTTIDQAGKSLFEPLLIAAHSATLHPWRTETRWGQFDWSFSASASDCR